MTSLYLTDFPIIPIYYYNKLTDNIVEYLNNPIELMCKKEQITLNNTLNNTLNKISIGDIDFIKNMFDECILQFKHFPIIDMKDSLHKNYIQIIKLFIKNNVKIPNEIFLSFTESNNTELLEYLTNLSIENFTYLENTKREPINCELIHKKIENYKKYLNLSKYNEDIFVDYLVIAELEFRVFKLGKIMNCASNLESFLISDDDDEFDILESITSSMHNKNIHDKLNYALNIHRENIMTTTLINSIQCKNILIIKYLLSIDVKTNNKCAEYAILTNDLEILKLICNCTIMPYNAIELCIDNKLIEIAKILITEYKVKVNRWHITRATDKKYTEMIELFNYTVN